MRPSTIKLLSWTLCWLCLSAQAYKRPIDSVLVSVNEDAILASDVDKFLEKAKSKNYQDLLGIDEKILSNRNAVLELLIEERIIDQQVKKLDIKASDQEVDGQIRAIVKRNGISQKQLADRLGQLGTSMADYRDGIRRQIERRNLVEREIKPGHEISEEQLRHFYQQNARPEDAESQYRIAHILVTTSKGEAAAKARAKKIAEEAKADPAKFDALAKEYSDDGATAQTGGGLGFFPESSLSREFKTAVIRTSEGGVTGPVKTSAGFHILKVLEIKAQDFASLPKERKEQLRNQLAGSELERKMAIWIERKKSEAHIKRFANDETKAK